MGELMGDRGRMRLVLGGSFASVSQPAKQFNCTTSSTATTNTNEIARLLLLLLISNDDSSAAPQTAPAADAQFVSVECDTRAAAAATTAHTHITCCSFSLSILLLSLLYNDVSQCDIKQIGWWSQAKPHGWIVASHCCCCCCCRVRA